MLVSFSLLSLDGVKEGNKRALEGVKDEFDRVRD